ncbi:MAG: hypothetical protein ACXWJ3_16380 [Caldimonas sp.]
MNEASGARATPRTALRMASWIGAACTAGLALWWLGHEDPAPPARVVEAIQPSVAAAASSAAAPLVDAAAAPVSPSDAEHEAEEMQLCGGGWLRVDGDEDRVARDIAAAVAARMDAVREPTLAAMRSSDDERVRAAAAYFEASAARYSLAEVGACKDAADCTRKSDELWQAPEPHRDALARLAQSTTDPVVYAWAHAACRRARGASACQLVNAAQWTRLDPDNAVPWLALADEARARGDGAAVDDAMFHVASAARFDASEGQLAAVLLDHAPAGESSLLGAAHLATQAIGFGSADAARSLQALGSYCRGRDLGDGNRRETCERIATLAAERSTSLLAQSIGISIGKRLGWPAQRLQAAEDERWAFNAVSMAQERGPTAEAGCAWAQNAVQQIRDRAEVGEVEAARRNVAATGRSVKELGVEARQRYAAARAQFAREAAAASAVAAGAGSMAAALGGDATTAPSSR